MESEESASRTHQSAAQHTSGGQPCSQPFSSGSINSKTAPRAESCERHGENGVMSGNASSVEDRKSSQAKQLLKYRSAREERRTLESAVSVDRGAYERQVDISIAKSNDVALGSKQSSKDKRQSTSHQDRSSQLQHPKLNKDLVNQKVLKQASKQTALDQAGALVPQRIKDVKIDGKKPSRLKIKDDIIKENILKASLSPKVQNLSTQRNAYKMAQPAFAFADDHQFAIQVKTTSHRSNHATVTISSGGHGSRRGRPPKPKTKLGKHQRNYTTIEARMPNLYASEVTDSFRKPFLGAHSPKHGVETFSDQINSNPLSQGYQIFQVDEKPRRPVTYKSREQLQAPAVMTEYHQDATPMAGQDAILSFASNQLCVGNIIYDGGNSDSASPRDPNTFVFNSQQDSLHVRETMREKTSPILNVEGSDLGYSPVGGHKNEQNFMTSMFHSGFVKQEDETEVKQEPSVRRKQKMPKIDTDKIQQQKFAEGKSTGGNTAKFAQEQSKKTLRTFRQKWNYPEVKTSKARMLEKRARDKEVARFKVGHEMKLERCVKSSQAIEPIMVKLWDLVGQPDPHTTLESNQHRTLGEVPMTTLPLAAFQRSVATLQLSLIKMEPAAYAEAYMNEVDKLGKREFAEKQEFTLTDFTEHVYRLFGAKLTMLPTSELHELIRRVFRDLQMAKVSSKTNQKLIQLRPFSNLYCELHSFAEKVKRKYDLRASGYNDALETNVQLSSSRVSVNDISNDQAIQLLEAINHVKRFILPAQDAHEIDEKLQGGNLYLYANQQQQHFMQQTLNSQRTRPAVSLEASLKDGQTRSPMMQGLSRRPSAYNMPDGSIKPVLFHNQVSHGDNTSMVGLSRGSSKKEIGRSASMKLNFEIGSQQTIQPHASSVGSGVSPSQHQQLKKRHTMVNVSDRRQLVKAIPELVQKREPLEGETISKSGTTYRHTRVQQFEYPIDDQGFVVVSNPIHTTIGSHHSAKELSRKRKQRERHSPVPKKDAQEKNEAQKAVSLLLQGMKKLHQKRQAAKCQHERAKVSHRTRPSTAGQQVSAAAVQRQRVLSGKVSGHQARQIMMLGVVPQRGEGNMSGNEWCRSAISSQQSNLKLSGHNTTTHNQRSKKRLFSGAVKSYGRTTDTSPPMATLAGQTEATLIRKELDQQFDPQLEIKVNKRIFSANVNQAANVISNRKRSDSHWSRQTPTLTNDPYPRQQEAGNDSPDSPSVTKTLAGKDTVMEQSKPASVLAIQLDNDLLQAGSPEPPELQLGKLIKPISVINASVAATAKPSASVQEEQVPAKGNEDICHVGTKKRPLTAMHTFGSRQPATSNYRNKLCRQIMNDQMKRDFTELQMQEELYSIDSGQPIELNVVYDCHEHVRDHDFAGIVALLPQAKPQRLRSSQPRRPVGQSRRPASTVTSDCRHQPSQRKVPDYYNRLGDAPKHPLSTSNDTYMAKVKQELTQRFHRNYNQSMMFGQEFLQEGKEETRMLQPEKCNPTEGVYKRLKKEIVDVDILARKKLTGGKVDVKQLERQMHPTRHPCPQDRTYTEMELQGTLLSGSLNKFSGPLRLASGQTGGSDNFFSAKTQTFNMHKLHKIEEEIISKAKAKGNFVEKKDESPKNLKSQGSQVSLVLKTRAKSAKFRIATQNARSQVMLLQRQQKATRNADGYDPDSRFCERTATMSNLMEGRSSQAGFTEMRTRRTRPTTASRAGVRRPTQYKEVTNDDDDELSMSLTVSGFQCGQLSSKDMVLGLNQMRMIERQMSNAHSYNILANN